MSSTYLIFERQWLHALLLAGLLAAVVGFAQVPAVKSGQLWELTSATWFALAITLPIMHQVYVWFCWRIELHTGGLSRVLGRAAFPLYAMGFSVLGIARVVVVFCLAIANQHMLPVESIPGGDVVLKTAAIVALVPAVYLFYSVGRYFGFRRAYGIDHFDVAYRSKPFVRGGIFRFTSNGMYIYGFLLMWMPGLWWASPAALVAAAFNHLYIWVHYYATELPDIRRIYHTR